MAQSTSGAGAVEQRLRRAARMAARGQGRGAVADVRAGGADCFRCTAGRGARSVDSSVGGLHGTAAV